MVELGLHVSEQGAVTVITASGEVDLGSAPRLRDLAVRRLTSGDRALVLDLTAVDFLDSTGLGTLVAVLKRARALGGDVGLVVSRPGIRKVFELTGLDAAFAIHDQLDDAILAAAGAGEVPDGHDG